MALPKILKKILPDNIVYYFELKSLHQGLNSKMSMEQWKEKGCPLPPPDVVKHGILSKYAKQFGADILVETGTFLGDTTFAMKDLFKKIYTIELDQKLFQRATKRFSAYAHIQTVQGDSAATLPTVLKSIPRNATCLFWLDGHYSGGVTSKGKQNTPIQEEIRAIYQHSERHVLLVDDARLFVGKDGYPTLSALRQEITQSHPNVQIEEKDDVIRITPF